MYSREYYLKNKERFRVWARAYRIKNKEKMQDYRIQYEKENKEQIAARKREYFQKNKEQKSAYRKEYRAKNRKKVNDTQRAYRSANKSRLRERDRKYAVDRYHTNIQARLGNLVRARIKDALGDKRKVGSAVRDLGCTVNELKFYLDGKLKDGMTWENYGYHGWHIDHIMPLAYFDLSDREQFLRAVHYTNLQPMWAKDNLRKGKKLLTVNEFPR